MKKVLEKIADILSLIFGYGIMLSILIGGLSFFAYIAALIIGGNNATAICCFIYKDLYPVLVYCTSILVVIGLVAMYFKGDKSLVYSKKKSKTDSNK